MPEQWIDAHQALEIAGDRHALCARLLAGLVVARAKLMIIGDQRDENRQITAGFWWAAGGAALNQNWETGDFSTWIDHELHCQAFGVKFALSGVLEMVPFEKRSTIVRGLSVASDPEWLSARDAQTFAYERLKLNPSVAGPAILAQAKLGFITARAVLAQGTTGDGSFDDWTWEEREWNVPNWFWLNFTGESRSNQGWVNGIFSGIGQGPKGTNSVTLSGVYFLRSTIEAMAGSKPTAPENIQTKRGRPPEYNWVTATSAIWAKIYGNDFNPMSQAEIELAFIQQLRTGDKEPSESTVRPYAKELWEKFVER